MVKMTEQELKDNKIISKSYWYDFNKFLGYSGVVLGLIPTSIVTLGVLTLSIIDIARNSLFTDGSFVKSIYHAVGTLFEIIFKAELTESVKTMLGFFITSAAPLLAGVTTILIGSSFIKSANQNVKDKNNFAKQIFDGITDEGKFSFEYNDITIDNEEIANIKELVSKNPRISIYQDGLYKDNFIGNYLVQINGFTEALKKAKEENLGTVKFD
jgi:hypothetical protein